MALPRTITDFGFASGYAQILGPYLVNGKYYVLSRDVTGGIKIFSPGSSTDAVWSEIDASNAPVPTANAPIHVSSVVDGNNIHAVWIQSDGTNVRAVYYARFSASSDTWQTITGGNKYVKISNGDDLGSAIPYICDIAVRSDGDIVTVYQGITEKIHGSNYPRACYNVSTDSGATWAGETYIDGSGVAETHHSPVCQIGSSDRTHIVWNDVAATDTNHRTLTSADVLQTIGAFHSTNLVPYGRCKYTSGANTKVGFVLAGGLVDFFTSADSPTLGTPDTAPGATPNNTALGLVADSGTKAYLGYSDQTTDDMWYDVNDNEGGWGTDVEVENTVTAIYASWGYDQTNNKLMWVRGSATTEGIYNEYSVAGSENTVTPTVGGIVVAGNTPTVQLTVNARPTIGSISTTGNTPSVQAINEITVALPEVGIDVSASSYDNKNGAVSDSTQPNGSCFKPDGTVIYVADNFSDAVESYVLSTAWDISSIGALSDTGSVSSETTNPNGVAFKTDGTKMYVTGGTKVVWEYTLGAAWDISPPTLNTSYDTTGTVSGNIGDVRFSDDGTKMYCLDTNNDIAHQFTLSTAWLVSSASSASKSLDFSGQTGSADQMQFSSDGKTVLISGGTDNKIYQYDLSTAWDLSSGAYSNKFYSTSSQTTNAAAVLWGNSDGTFYAMNYSTQTYYQYTIGQGEIGSVAVVGNTPTAQGVNEQNTAPSIGSVTVTGNTPAIALEAAAQPLSGAISVDGYVVTISTEIVATVAPTGGSVAVTGHVPTVSLGEVTNTAEPTVGSISVTGNTPVIGLEFTALPDTGTISITGDVPTVSTGTETTLAPQAGSITTSADPPTLTVTNILTPQTGSITIAGNTPAVSSGAENTVSPASGSVAVAGNTPALATEITSSPDSGSIGVSGNTPTITATVINTVAPEVGSIGVDGNTPGLSFGIITLDIQTSGITVVGSVPTVEAVNEVVSDVAPTLGVISVDGNVITIGVDTGAWDPITAQAATWTAVSAGSATWSAVANNAATWQHINRR